MKCILLLILLPTLVTAEPIMSVEDRVASLLLQAEESCAGEDGILELSGEEVARYDFDQDGKTDLTVLQEHGYYCSISASYYSGTGGAVAHFMTEVDYTHALVRDFEVMNAFHKVPVILLMLHGSSCDTFGFVACVQAITIHEGRFLTYFSSS